MPSAICSSRLLGASRYPIAEINETSIKRNVHAAGKSANANTIAMADNETAHDPVASRGVGLSKINAASHSGGSVKYGERTRVAPTLSAGG
jgi:hypothetical protein